MDCMARPDNYLDLKLEDNGDYYLINSFLGFEKNDADPFIDELIDHPHPPAPDSTERTGQAFGDEMVREVATYLCFRTTSLRDILNYIQQYYQVPPHCHKMVLNSARKLKLQLKRAHARQRNPLPELNPEIESVLLCGVQIKVEQSELSPFLFEQESQQTRKKKRNRMSAQNSRDRKKEYIQQIQNQNRELKRRMAHAERLNRTSSTSKQFVKMILCLGITCYANLQRTNTHIPSPPLQTTITHTQKIPIDKPNCINLQEQKFIPVKNSLPMEMQFLNPWQQNTISEILEILGQKKESSKTTAYSGFQCTDLISEVESEHSTSSEGGRKSNKTQFL